MERNVYISIKGMHSAERDDDYGEVEVVAQGKYYERNGKYYISYEESLFRREPLFRAGQENDSILSYAFRRIGDRGVDKEFGDGSERA